MSPVTLEKIVSLAKRRSFVYQTAELYGGLNGVYDMGHLGVLLKDNIKQAWKTSIKSFDGTLLFLDGALLGPELVWQASGHVENFHDPMVDCLQCKYRYRADDINLEKPCPHCGKTSWTDIRQFNMMFKTNLGALSDATSIAYLRPETAQTIFVNFKNMMATNRVKIPFGIAQIGKAFRNEITPKQFLFRVREFEQMEVEWFCKPETSDAYFDAWVTARSKFYDLVGINKEHIRLFEQPAEERAHYSRRTIDIEYHFPFGWKELEGIAHRGNYDLTQHSTHSGKDISVFDEESQTSYIPHVVECSVGVDRLLLALLCDAFHEDTLGGETRTVLKFAPAIAPIKAAVLPLTKKLSPHARTLYENLKQISPDIEFDESGSIGKRYRRQDEIGTPVCFTFDFESLDDHCVTARNRDTLQQERISIDRVADYLKKLLYS